MIGQCMPSASPRVNTTLSSNNASNPEDPAHDSPNEVGAETEYMDDVVTSKTQDPGQSETRAYLELATGQEMVHPEPKIPVERSQRTLVIEEANIHIESFTIHA
jgi:hypothetical protein